MAFQLCLLALLLSLPTRSVLAGDAFRAAGLAQGEARVTGRISVAGGYAAPKALPVFKNRDFCGSQVANETLMVGDRGGLKNAVVVLRSLDQPVSATPTRVILDNQNCAFAPHVQVAPLGSELALKNSDPILHTVHARMGQETLFNVGLPSWRVVTKRLNRAGVVRIDCDVLHTWMSAAIVVTRSPYFAVSDENGSFLVDRLPVGRYQVDIWHEKLGAKTTQLSVTDNRLISLEVVFAMTENLK